MIKVTNTGTLTGVSVSDVQQNLRLPSDFDYDLIEIILDATVEHIEQMTSKCLISKNVKEVFIDNNCRMYLKYPANAITSVIVNEVPLTENDYKKVINVSPSCIMYTLTPSMQSLTGDNIIEVNYTAVGEVTPALRNLIMAICSIYYNNPEGSGAIDQSRINMIINTHMNRII